MFRRVDGEHRDAHRDRRLAGRRRRAAARVDHQHSRASRSIELTSYAEVVLAPGDADLAHPAFSNLFVETGAVPERDALICARRPRSGTERVVPRSRAERSRPRRRRRRSTKPIARGSSAAAARSRGPPRCSSRDALSNTTGPVLDPIVSLRQTIRAAAWRHRARRRSRPAYADDEDGATQLIEKYHDRRAVARALALASTHSQIELRHLGLTVDDTILLPAAGAAG